MNLKLNTATLVLSDREMPLDRNIARQIDIEYGEYLTKHSKIEVLGTISLCEEREWREWVLMSVDEEIRRMPVSTYINCGFAAQLGEPRSFKRIILP